MATRMPNSERSPSPPSPLDQRDAAIQELQKGSDLVKLLGEQLGRLPVQLGCRDDALTSVRDISMSLDSSLYALQSERDQHRGSSSGAGGPGAVTSDGGGGRSSTRARRTTHRRGKHGEEHPRRIFTTTTPENDGYHWRKYGEKTILNTEFPKLYYRCGYSDERKCQAKKYVQQANRKHPPEFTVTLTNEHTCNTLLPDQPSSSSTSQVLDFTKASMSSPMDPHADTAMLKEEEEEEAPSIDESTRIMSTSVSSYGAYDYNELSPQSWK
ncbi:WRKY transcription factor 55-like [Oryza brachyantha]|uniref:WRKY transcription factor 55-like n=1 Tax=Oryza brachyantha TaxID=4533 RepID=UPI0007764ABF|nr:WRKY transcription factor 55-like [Oryza brachyantha]